MVLIHDAVRPFVDAALIDRTIAAIGERQAALPAMPVADTLKRRTATAMVGETVPRAGLHAAQTPQGFPFWPILAAHEKAFQLGKHDFTDDAAIAEWAKYPGAHRRGLAGQCQAHLGKGYRHGRPAAWRRQAWPFPMSAPATATTCMPSSRATMSRCAASRSRMRKKLSGHSDADVGLHALTDALLATCGAGDIGTHFPPSDPQWKGAASRSSSSMRQGSCARTAAASPMPTSR